MNSNNQNMIIRVLEENLEATDEIEWLDEDALVPIDDLIEEMPLNAILSDAQSKEDRSANEEKSINKTLAEMSFMEANDLLANGNYEMASERYQEALKYSPDNTIYQRKLHEVSELIKAKITNNPSRYATAKIPVVSPLKHTVETHQVNKPSSQIHNKEDKDNKGVSENSITETLAEMAFMEANDLVAKGDYLAAIDRYREAIKYAPTNNDYATKLANVLNESKTAKTALLKKPEAAAELVEDSHEEKPHSHKPSKSSKSSRLKKDANTIDTDTPLSLGSKKPSRSKNYVLVVILLGVIITSVALFYQSTKVTLTLVQLSFPTDQAKLSKNQLDFEWQSKGDNFLFQIEYLGDVIVEAYTTETRYKLSENQTKLIKTKINYKWRVTPVDFKGQPIPHKTEEKWFEVIQ